MSTAIIARQLKYTPQKNCADPTNSTHALSTNSVLWPHKRPLKHHEKAPKRRTQCKWHIQTSPEHTFWMQFKKESRQHTEMSQNAIPAIISERHTNKRHKRLRLTRKKQNMQSQPTRIHCTCPSHLSNPCTSRKCCPHHTTHPQRHESIAHATRNRDSSQRHGHKMLRMSRETRSYVT